MITQILRHNARAGIVRAGLSLLALLALCGPATADVPDPIFQLDGDRLRDGKVELTLPAGEAGQISGEVSGDGESIVFRGVPGQIEFAFGSKDLAASPFTVFATVEPTGVNGYGEIFNCNRPKGFVLRTYGGAGGFSVSAGGTWNLLVSPKETFRQGARQNVAMVYDGSQVVLYVDGLEAGRAALEQVPEGDANAIVGGMGRKTEGGDITDVPDFRVFRVAFYDTALSAEQISELSQAGGAGAPSRPKSR